MAQTKQFSDSELKLIADAARYLENPYLLMQMADAVGKDRQSTTDGRTRLRGAGQILRKYDYTP